MAKDNKLTFEDIDGMIQALDQGDVLLVQVVSTETDKVQLEFAEKIRSMEDPGSLLSIMNADDERFSSGARRAWLTSSVALVKANFGIDCGPDADWIDHPTREGKQVILVGELNPGLKGFRVRVQITESTEPINEWETENVEQAAKRKGKDGEFILHKGQYIFSRTNAVLKKEGEDPTHTYLEADAVGATATEKIEDEVGM